MQFRVGVILACAALAARAAEFEEEKDVIVLDEENFDAVVTQFPLLLVEFYAPWCGHCKKLEPEYAKAATKLKGLDEHLRIAKMDATEARDIADRYGVRGFPTLKLFRGLDSVSDFEGGRSADDIYKFMVKKSGPPAKDVASMADVEELTGKNDVVVVGVFEDKTSAAFATFMDVAAKTDDLIFATGPPSALDYGVSAGVVVLKNFDDGKATMEVTEATTASDLKTFVDGEAMPLVVEFSQDTAPKIFGGDINVHILTFADKEADYLEATKADMSKVAANYKGRALSVLVPSTESRIVDYFGVKTEDMPATVIAKMGEGGMKKYIMEGNTNGDALEAHAAAFFAGSLKPTLKSEEPAPEDTEEPVVVLKGKSFNEIVIDNDKDVLVEFYAPWCGHCKALAPKYDELAEKFAGVDSVVIAKMDATANEIDVDGVNVKGFPTIMFFKGDNKAEPMAYSGAREVDGFVDFLTKNAATPFTLDAAATGADEL